MRIALITGASSGLGAGFAREVVQKENNIDEIWLIARRRERLEEVAPTYEGIIISIGNNKMRRELIERLEAVGAPITTLIHPTAFVSSSAKIGTGSIVLPGAVIHTNAKVGKGCIISIGALIDHDCVVGDYCHIDAGAVCRSRSQVLDGLKIEANTVS